MTLVHKGNIMKFTEGAFRDWGYELAKAEFRDQIGDRGRSAGAAPRATGRCVMNDRDRRQRVPAGAHADRRITTSSRRRT